MDRASVFRAAVHLLGEADYTPDTPTLRACEEAFNIVLRDASARGGEHYMLSMNTPDSPKKIKNKLKERKLVYSKQTKEALSFSNGAPRLFPDLVRLAVAQGFNENTITKADIVKREDSFSSSIADTSMYRINQDAKAD